MGRTGEAGLLTMLGGSTAPGRTVLCLPGLGAQGETFRRLAPLAERWRLALWTPPPETPPERTPLEHHLGLLERAALPSRFVVIGSSFGSLTALHLALALPERVRALVLVGPVAGVEGMRRGLLAAALALRLPMALSPALAPVMARVLGGFRLDSEAHALLCEGIRGLAAPELARRLAEVLAPERRPALESLRVPTLVVQGTRDGLVPRAHAEAVAQRVPGAQLALIEGGSHVPYLSHARAFLDVVEPFLAGLPDEAPSKAGDAG